MKRIREIRREEKVTLELSESDVRGMIEDYLKVLGIELPERGVDIYMQVPGGMDWSNEPISLGRESNLFVGFTTIKEDESDDVPQR